MGPAIVPRRWPGRTVVCLASGPSLTAPDVARTAEYPTIAISDTYQLAPHAAVLYAPDWQWWRWHPEAESSRLPKYGLHPRLLEHPTIECLTHMAGEGLSPDPRYLCGSHSGIQAINFAVLAGAARIVLLGYDMGPAPDGTNHFFGEHPNRKHVNYVRRVFEYDELIGPLARLGVEVVNCSRTTRITAFPRASLDMVLGTVVH